MLCVHCTYFEHRTSAHLFTIHHLTWYITFIQCAATQFNIKYKTNISKLIVHLRWNVFCTIFQVLDCLSDRISDKKLNDTKEKWSHFFVRSLSLSSALHSSIWIYANLNECHILIADIEWVPPEDKRWIIFMANCTQWKLVPHFLEYTWCKLFWEHSKHSTFDSINLYGYANLRTGWALRSERNGKEIGYSGEILNWIFYLKNIYMNWLIQLNGLS